MIKLSFLDLICEISFNAIGSERELLAVINEDIEDVRTGNIEEKNFKFLEFNEVEEFINQLHKMEEQFQEAYLYEDRRILCNFLDKQFIVDLM